MKTEWQTVKISGACEFVVDCVNKTAPLSVSVTPYKMIRTSHIKDGFIRLTDEKCVSEETYAQWTRRASLERGDVLLTREAPLGSVAMVRDEKTHFLGQRIVQYRSDPRVLHSSFLLYTFCLLLYRHSFTPMAGRDQPLITYVSPTAWSLRSLCLLFLTRRQSPISSAPWMTRSNSTEGPMKHLRT